MVLINKLTIFKKLKKLTMIYKIIHSLRYKLEFKLLTYLIVLSIILSLSGCATTETQRVSSDNMHYKMNYKIINVIMKNGLVLDLQDKSALYFREYNNKKNVILYITADSIRVSKDSLNLSPVTKVVELDDVKNVTIEKSGTNVVIPILIISGCAVLLVLFSVLSWIQSGGIMQGFGN